MQGALLLCVNWMAVPYVRDSVVVHDFLVEDRSIFPVVIETIAGD